MTAPLAFANHPFVNYADWYWVVGGDTENVWSSRRYSSVPISDPDYVAWQAAGLSPRPIASLADLQAMFALQYPAGMLESYCVYKRWVKEQGGITLSSGMPIQTDDRAQAKINGLVLACQGKSNFATQFHAADGSFWPLQETDIINMSTELQGHINQCFSASQQTMIGIANGSITTLEQIDSGFQSIVTRRG